MEHIDGIVKWAAMWLQFAKDRPNLVVFTFHRELENPQAMLSRVFGELGAKLDGSVSAEPAGRDRFREKEVDDWRSDLSPASQSYLEHHVRAKLGDFPDFANLWR